MSHLLCHIFVVTSFSLYLQPATGIQDLSLDVISDVIFNQMFDCMLVVFGLAPIGLARPRVGAALGLNSGCHPGSIKI